MHSSLEIEWRTGEDRYNIPKDLTHPIVENDIVCKKSSFHVGFLPTSVQLSSKSKRSAVDRSAQVMDNGPSPVTRAFALNIFEHELRLGWLIDQLDRAIAYGPVYRRGDSKVSMQWLQRVKDGRSRANQGSASSNDPSRRLRTRSFTPSTCTSEGSIFPHRS